MKAENYKSYIPYSLPRWLDHREIEKLMEKRNCTIDEARQELFEEN